MARLWSSGAELNSVTADVEITSTNSSPTVVSNIFRSGNYSFRSNASGFSTVIYYRFQTSGTLNGFLRVYFNIGTAPVAQARMICLNDGTTTRRVVIRVNTDRTLELWNADSTQVGSDSSALILNNWYRIDVKFDNTGAGGSHTLDASINGVSFASSNSLTLGNVSHVAIGDIDSTSNTYYDDIAINDSTGSFQNSYPGDGRIIHLNPNAAGDNSGWTNGYTAVDEITPNDVTDFISSNTLDQISDFNLNNTSVMGAQTTINCVQVGVRFNGAGASSNASFVLRIKAAASGTVEESSAITPSNTTWVTNAAASPRNYSLTLYDLPGASTTAWTYADLDSTQIGVRLSATSTNAAQVSTLWLLVDYTGQLENKVPSGIKPSYDL